VSSYYYTISVLMLLYYISVIILLYYMCVLVSVLIPLGISVRAGGNARDAARRKGGLHMCRHTTMCVLILLESPKSLLVSLTPEEEDEDIGQDHREARGKERAGGGSITWEQFPPC
jgi:hypothetical protein